jgi:antitoxin component of MazEF toxin-antitoxin module
MSDEEELPASTAEEWFTRLTPDGHVVLPPDVLSRLNLKEGSRLRLRLDGQRIVLSTQAEIVREIQEKCRRLIPGDRSLADELFGDRRAEAQRDD